MWIQQSRSVQCLCSPSEHTRGPYWKRLESLHIAPLNRKWQIDNLIESKKKSILIFFPTLFECAPQAEKQKAAAVLDKVCLWRCAHQMSPPLDPMSPQIKPNPNKNPVQSQRRKGASMKHNLHSTILVMWLEKSKNNGAHCTKRSWNWRKQDKKAKLRIDEIRILCIEKQEQHKIPNMVSIQFRHIRFNFQELDNRWNSEVYS